MSVHQTVITAMITAGVIAAVVPTARAQGKDVLGEAISLCETGQVEKAITLSKKATERASHDPNAWIAYGTALVADGQFADGSKAMFKAAEAMRNANPSMGGMPVQGLDKAIEARAWLFEGMAEKIAKAPTPEIADHVRKGCLYLESCISDIKMAETHFNDALRMAQVGGFNDAATLYKGILDTLPQRPEYKKAHTPSTPSQPATTRAAQGITFDVDLGNLKTEPVVKALKTKSPQMKPYADRDVTLVVRGVGDASFYPKDGQFVVKASANCKLRDNPTQNILQEFTITVEATDLGEALAGEVVKRLQR